MKKQERAHRVIAFGLALIIAMGNIPSTALASNITEQGEIGDSIETETTEPEIIEEEKVEEETTEIENENTEGGEAEPTEEEIETTEEIPSTSTEDNTAEENTEENGESNTEENGESNTEEVENPENTEEGANKSEENTEDQKETYIIKFVDTNDNEISTQEIKEVAEIELPEAPEVEGYVFVKWDVDLENLELTEDITIKPIYEEIVEEEQKIKFIVTFVDMEGNEISSQEVKEVAEIELPEAPEVEGYTFIEWDIDLETLELTEDIIVEPIYEKIEIELVQKTLKTTIDNKEISIIGNIPVDAELIVKKVSYTSNIQKNIENTLDGEVTVTIYEAFDIKIKVGEEEYQPNEFDETVTVSIKNIEVEENKEEELKVFHIDNTDTVEEISATIDSDKAEFEADSFSIYVVAGVSYNTEDGTLLENDYATAYLFGDGTLLVTGFKKGTYGTEREEVYPWYTEKDNITSIEFADTVTEICSFAFNGYTNIQGELHIPNSVVTIGTSAFSNCKGLTGDLVIPDSVTTIEETAFANCSGFNGTLTLSNKLTSISGAAFYNCNGLSGTLTIPDSVNTIRVRSDVSGNIGAFEGCSGFTSLDLGNGVVTIQDRAFNNCSGFTGELIIPDSVVEIGRDLISSYGAVFENCTGFTSLSLGNSVKVIHDGAFNNCSGFRGNLVIPNSVEKIHANAFNNCGFDGTITLSNNLQFIGKGAFRNCSSLVGDLVIPDSVTEMKEFAFADCSGFKGSLTIGNGLSVIEGAAFYNCSGFTGKLTIPDTITTLKVFEEFGTREGAFQNCSGFTSLDLGNGVTWIQGRAFMGCTGITGEVVIPASVTTIGHEIIYDLADTNTGAFSGCTGITKLTLNEGLINIYGYSFNECHNITGTIEIPSSVKKVTNKAFYNCYGIDDIQINSDFSYDDNVFFVEPEHKIHTTSNWNEIRGTNNWSTLAHGWNRFIGTFTVKFDTDGGSEVADQEIEIGEKVTEPEEPKKDEYRFIGWFKDEELENQWNFDNDTVIEDTTLYAKWEKIPVVTFVLDENRSNEVASKYNSYNHYSLKGYWLEQPEDPKKEDHAFKGWSLTPNGDIIKFTKQTKYSFENTSDITIQDSNYTVPLYGMITKDTTLYAVWEKAPVVTLKDGDKTISTITTKYNSYPNNKGFWLEKPEELKKTGYTFKGWSQTPNGNTIEFNKKTKYDFENTSSITIQDSYYTVPIYKVTEDTTLYAIWEKVPEITFVNGEESFKVTSKYNINSGSNHSSTVGYWVERPENPIKNEYSFKGWSLTPNGDVVVFDKLLGYNFENTSDVTLNGDSTVPIYKVTEDTTLYAIWAKTPIVTLKDKDKTISTVTTKYNSLDSDFCIGFWLEQPEEPIKGGHAFKGWSLTPDGDVINFTQYDNWAFINTSDITIDGDSTVPIYRVTEDTTLYAVWEVTAYKVTFKDGDKTISTVTTKYNDHTANVYNGFWLEKPEDPEKAGYKFSHWSLTPDGNTVTFKDYPSSYFENTSNITLNGNRTVKIYGKVAEDTTLYAVWVKIPLGIFKDGDKTISTVESKYNEHSNPDFRGFWLEKPEDPKKAGYRFVRWEPNTDETVKTYFVEFPKSSFIVSDIETNGENTVPIIKLKEDIEFTAVWEEIIPVITFKDGDTIVSTQTSKYNAKSETIDNSEYVGYWVEYVDAPYKEGYSFTGWSLVPNNNSYENHVSFNEYPADNFKNTSDISMNQWDDTYTNLISKVSEDATFYAIYEKNTYNVIFNSDGGSDVEVQFIEHGNKASRPEDPTKEGNTFIGWYIYDWTTHRDKLFDFENTPIKQYTYLTAKWEPAKYEVTFNSNGGSAVSSQTITHGNKVQKPVDPTKEGSEFKYWYLEGEPDTAYDFDTPVKEKTKLVAKWEVKKYTVSFDSGTDEEIPDKEVEHGKPVEKPEDPTREGAEFKGWYPEDDPDTPYDFDEPVKEEIKLIAKWDVAKYEVTFDSNGGSSVPSQTIEHGNKVQKPVDPTKEGYQLKNWLTEDGKEFDFNTPIKSAMKLTAEWEIKRYKVTFDSGTDEKIPDQEVEHNNTIKKPTDPIKEGAEFIGWYTEEDPDTPYDFDEPVKDEVKLIAKWNINKYEVTFDSNGGSKVPTQTIEHDSQAKKPVDPTKEGFTIIGWFTEDDKEFSFDTPIKDNIKLIAKWEIKKYTITFDSNGGSEVPDQEVEHNSNVTEPKEPTREGAEFLYWYTEDKPDEPFDFENTPIKDETKLIAKWDVNKYEITFDSDGGSPVPSQEVEHGNKANKPKNPTKPDYKFEGWYTEDGKEFDWNTPIKEEIRLIAKWKEIVYQTVSFVTNNDQTLEDVKVEQGTPVKTPTGLVKTGYEIEGWYTDEEFTMKWNFNNNVDSDITLYAKWIEKKVIVEPSTKPDKIPEQKPDTTPEQTPDIIPSVTPEQTPSVTPKESPVPSFIPETTYEPGNGSEPEGNNEPSDNEKLNSPAPISDMGDTNSSEEKLNDKEPITNIDESLYVGSLDDEVENMKNAMARFIGAVKKVAIVISISALAILGILWLLLLLIAWIKKVKVLNDYNTDEYKEEDFQVVYKTSVESEGNRIAELFRSEDRVWKLIIPEKIITERKTDSFEIELKKHFAKKYNGEQIVVILDNENEDKVITLGFVIDKEDNILAFEYNENEINE